MQILGQKQPDVKESQKKPNAAEERLSVRHRTRSHPLLTSLLQHMLYKEDA
jgi:hypothetical protein